MCGRFLLFTTTEALVSSVSRYLGVRVAALPGDWLRPSWNVAPTHRVAVVRRFRGEMVLGPAVWGFPALWKPGSVLFNARGETAFDKASFRGAEPALVVMDGWYEWKVGSGERTPYCVRGDGVLVVAGLVRPSPGDPPGGELRATVVTSASKLPVERLHDRMPRLLGEDEAVVWLTGNGDALRTFAAQQPPDAVCATLWTRKVDPRVGNVGVNGPGLLPDTMEE